jgi:hypothetical protein
MEPFLVLVQGDAVKRDSDPVRSGHSASVSENRPVSVFKVTGRRELGEGQGHVVAGLLPNAR